MSVSRSVPHNRRAFALGTQMIIWRLLGNIFNSFKCVTLVETALCSATGAIPGPIIFGLFIDSSCVLWTQSSDKCGTSDSDNSGSCLVYDNYSFSRYRYSSSLFETTAFSWIILFLFRAMVGIALIGKGLTLMFAFLSWWFYAPPTKLAATKDVKDGPKESVNPTVQTKEIYAYVNTSFDRS